MTGVGVPSSVYVIDYDGTFIFPAPAAELWTTIARFDCFPSWWSWLREFAVQGSGLRDGTSLHGIVAPPLPYRMRLDVVLEECVPEQRLTAIVHGDLEGPAQLTFEGDDSETRVHATNAQARRRFAGYWAVIRPGSGFIRRMWLRAIRRRAESQV